jgi:hypothetical protein
MNCKRTTAPLIFAEVFRTRRARAHTSFSSHTNFPRTLAPRQSVDVRESHAKIVAQIQPFVHFVPPNSPRINTSKKFPIPRISLIRLDFNSTRINTSGNKDLKSIRISTSGSKDLNSFRINTSKKHGRGGVPPKLTTPPARRPFIRHPTVALFLGKRGVIR